MEKFRRMNIKTLLISQILYFPVLAVAQGFDDSYTAYSGCYNSDGLTDIYISGTPQPRFVPIVVNGIVDFFIPIGTAVDDFILVQNSDQTFTLHSGLTAAQKQTLSQWPLADIELVISDFNVDGIADILVKGVANVIADAFDQIVYAPATKGIVPPLAITNVDSDFQHFFQEVHS